MNNNVGAPRRYVGAARNKIIISRDRSLCLSVIKDLKFDEKGLVPAIIQDYKTKDVLMVAYMNLESLKRTLKSGKTCFWSRSRQEYWIKGLSSGNYQFVKAIYYDCDRDALLVKVRQIGPACHTGSKTCFYNKIK